MSRTDKVNEAQEVSESFGCDGNPLAYAIKTQARIEFVGDDDVTTDKDFEDLF